MGKIKISIVTLGTLNRNVDFHYLTNWSSKILKITRGGAITHLPDIEGSEWEYTDQQLAQLIETDINADFTVALVNAPLVEDYYLRSVAEKKVVLSFYEMADLVTTNNFSIEHYILRNTYEMAVLFAKCHGVVPDNQRAGVHDDTRGCLFDFNPSKVEILSSMDRPNLCDECKASLSRVQLDPDFIPSLEKELKRLRKSLYARIVDFVKAHPILAMLITAAGSVLLNLLANIIYDLGKPFFFK